MMENHFRKVAAHRILLPNGHIVLFSVVFIRGEHVIGIQPLKSEQAATEWLPGTIHINTDSQNIPYASYKGTRLKEIR